MTPSQFHEWRADLRLSLRGAAKILHLSLLTVQGYDRGFRHDDGRPVVIPEKVALACEALRARARAAGTLTELENVSQAVQPEPEVQLPLWGDLSKDVKGLVLTVLKAQPLILEVPFDQVFLTKVESFAPLAGQIMPWLEEHAGKGHQLRILNHPDANQGQIVVLEIADKDHAFEFKARWYGATFDEEGQP